MTAFSSQLSALSLAVALVHRCSRGRTCSSAAEPLFVESAASVGLAFTHVSGATGQYYMAEQMGAGVALFDYDMDGDLDVFLVQGGPFDAGGKVGASHPTSRLFRNDLKVSASGKPACCSSPT